MTTESKAVKSDGGEGKCLLRRLFFGSFLRKPPTAALKPPADSTHPHRTQAVCGHHEGEPAMILIVNGKATEKQMHNLLSWIDSQHLQAHISKGDYTTIVGLVGDTSHLDIEQIRSIDIVDRKSVV